MSTKIYTAYRVKNTDYPDFAYALHNYMLEQASEIVQRVAGSVTEKFLRDKYNQNGWDKKFSFDEFLNDRGEHLRVHKAFELLDKVSRKVERVPGLDVDCCWVCYPFENYFYIIPGGEPYLFEGFSIEDYKGESFHYWNNTDPDETIPYEDWKKRGDIWDQLFNEQSLKLVHEVVCIKDDEGIFEIVDKLLGVKGNSMFIGLVRDGETNKEDFKGLSPYWPVDFLLGP